MLPIQPEPWVSSSGLLVENLLCSHYGIAWILAVAMAAWQSVVEVSTFGGPTGGSSSSLICQIKVCDYEETETIMMVMVILGVLQRC